MFSFLVIYILLKIANKKYIYIICNLLDRIICKLLIYHILMNLLEKLQI